MNIQTISAKELREDFSRLLTAMDNKQKLLLLYRSKPLAEITPVARQRDYTRNFSQRQLNRWTKEDKLTAGQQRKIDEIINCLP